MRRFAILGYGTVCYAVFFATFLYLVGFLGNLGVPRSIDGPGEGPWLAALVGNAALLLLFGLQHSAMARPAFKARLTRVLPRAAERSTYVLATSAVLVLTFWLWQPMPALVWETGGAVRIALTGLFFAGVGLVLYSTCLIDHFDLFGLRQVVLQFRGRPYTEKNFVTPSLYKLVRHPLYVGWLTVFWAAPEMSVGHLLFSLFNTGYILVAIGYEERDLADALGEDYRRYRASTPMFVPRLRNGAAQPAPTPAPQAR